jgi:regulatory protein SWI5
MEETIKPVRCNRPNSGIFQELRQQAEALIQTPPRANTMPVAFANQGLRTPEFMSMRNISAEFMRIQQFDGLPTGELDMRVNPSPMKPLGPGFGSQNAFDNKPDLLPATDFDSQKTVIPFRASSPGSKSPSRRGSPHRRTESVASITSAASISDINIEETKTETGVTLDDIATYIQGPDPSDGKWLCLFDDCQKRFGRKENIKSHVQTHLNDRQYQCPSCHKCFVRQHDLKRHAKIHTGVKPYPCECGNSFARHDALTRHRQRGMCIGAFDGIVRKVVKRGRPKKIRPDMDDRLDKADRTRRKNKSASISSASSQSGYSDSSAANSPSNEFDGLMDDDQFPGIMDVAISNIPSSATMNPAGMGVSSAPMPTIRGNMAEVFSSISPITHAQSPSALSNYSHASYASHASRAGSRPASDFTAAREHRGAAETHNPPSPAKSVASHYTHVAGSPPELSSTSSPPPTSTSARFFDLDPNSSGISDTSIGLGTTVAAHAAAGSVDCGTSGACIPGLTAMDNDMLLQFTDDGLVQLDQSMMLGKFDKFDEDYDAVNMFTNSEDVFFGTS